MFRTQRVRISPMGIDSFNGGLLTRSACLNILSKIIKIIGRVLLFNSGLSLIVSAIASLELPLGAVPQLGVLCGLLILSGLIPGRGCR